MAYGRKSISNRLSRYVLLISAGLFVVVTLLLGFLTRRIIERVSEAVAAKDLELAVSEVEKVITEVERAVDNVDWFVERNSSRQSFMTEATRELVSANPNIIGSAVAYEPYYFPRKRWSAVYTYIDAETKDSTGTGFPACTTSRCGASRISTKAPAPSGWRLIPSRFGIRRAAFSE